MQKKIYELTKDGVDKLNEELSYLKDVKRPENVEAIKEARAQGDLSENADYEAARNEQAQIEARIHEIETILKNHKIIQVKDDDLVNIGKTVKLLMIEKKIEKTFLLVGGVEANPGEGKISIESPIGKAIRDHGEGETVKYKTGSNKEFSVKILEIIKSA